MIDDGEMMLLPPWKNAAAELFGKKYTFGQIVPHDELQEAMGLTKPTGKVDVEQYEQWRLQLLSQIDALATFLLEERNMCLKAVPGQGYLIVEPAKQTQFAMDDGMKKVKAELRKMGRRLSFIDRTALSHDEARENADALARLSFLNQQANKVRRLKFTEKAEKD